jgi:hypothetical protein
MIAKSGRLTSTFWFFSARQASIFAPQQKALVELPYSQKKRTKAKRMKNVYWHMAEVNDLG